MDVKPSGWVRRKYAIKSLDRSFKGLSIHNITKHQVEDWAIAKATTVSPATYNKELDVLRMIFRYGVEHGLLLDNPAAAVKRRRVPQPQIMVPTKEQFRALVADLRKYPFTDLKDTKPAADLCELCAYSGCRLGEAVALCWGDIDLQRKNMTIRGGEFGTKNGQVRIIPLFPPLERLLRTIRGRMNSEPGPDQRILKTKSAKIALTSACQRLGLPHFLHHSLRHFFATNAVVEAGVDFSTVAAWLGHRDGGLVLARVYSHIREGHSTEMAKRMVFDAAV